MSLGNYCPYTNGNVVYLKCQECEDKICEEDWFFCGVAGTPLSMTKSRKEMADVMEVMYAMGKTCAVSKREIEQVRSQKAAEKGTFSKKIFLVSTEK